MASGIRVQVVSDLRRLDALEQRVPRNVERSVREAAEALRNDIRSSWSPVSPSNPGQPPAEDTGNLDSAIFVEDAGRGLGGRFASGKDAFAHLVRIDTTKGQFYHGRGGYEGYLEYGTSKMEARPFIEPAVERLEGTFERFFANIFK